MIYFNTYSFSHKAISIFLYSILLFFVIPIGASHAYSEEDIMSSFCFNSYKNDMGYAKAIKYCDGSNSAISIFMGKRHDSGIMLHEFIEGIMTQVTKKIGHQYQGRLIQFYDTGFTTYPTSTSNRWLVIRRINWTYLRNPRLLGRKGFYVIYSVNLKESSVNFMRKVSIND